MISSFFYALRRLSVLPVGERPPPPEGREGDAVALFPVAGLAVALFPAAVLVLAGLIFVPPLPEALAVAALAAVTGAVHLAGLGRTVEAVLSGKPPLGALEVMREARAGAWGAAVVTLLLLVKFSALAALGAELGGSAAGQVLGLVLAVCLARWAAVVLAVRSDYARPEGGEDEALIAYAGGRELNWSLAPVVVVVLVLGTLMSWPVGLWRAILAMAGCALLAWGAALYFSRRLGGATGECLGAVIELAEVLALVLMCVLPAARPAPPEAAGGRTPGAVRASAAAGPRKGPAPASTPGGKVPGRPRPTGY